METKAHKDLTDAELLNRYRQSGDKVFVGVLYKRYSHLVFGLCMKYFKDQDQAYDTSVNIFTKLFIAPYVLSGFTISFFDVYNELI